MRRPYRTGLLLFLTLFAGLAPLSAMAETSSPRSPLADSGSPYLRLHADDPLAWRVWDASVLADAQRDNRLIFLSIGYYACHWCHVMQRESFQDAAVAAYVNKHFVAVKVDREVEPVLDERMMAFLEATRGQGGWPLNVFLTPEGHPLIGTVYQPRDDFLAFLQRLQQRWADDDAQLAAVAAGAWRELNAASPEALPLERPLNPAAARRGLLRQALAEADEFSGGFGNQSKFPLPARLAALLALPAGEREPLDAFLRTTLDAMRDGGLRDHVGEGFFRYTEDPFWEVPHFEKMLYDNAQLAALYLEAAAVLDEPAYRATGLATLGFMERALRHPAGGYIASLSAVDDRDVEGGYYLFEADAVRRAAGADWPLVKAAWALERPAHFEAGHLLHLQAPPAALASRLEVTPGELAAALERTASGLRELRAARGLPRDEKRLTAWNGLALTALAAGAAADDAAAARAGRELLAFARESLWVEGALRRGLDEAGGSLGPGLLADYALLADGAVAWARHSGAAADWQFARELVQAAWAGFYADGRWQAQPDTLLPGQSAVLLLPDDVLPSATTALLAATAAVADHFDDGELAGRVAAARERQPQSLGPQPLLHGGYITRVLSAAPQ